MPRRRVGGETLAQFKTALAKAEAVCVVLRLACEEIEKQEDEHICANVVTFATNFAVRQTASISHDLTAIP